MFCGILVCQGILYNCIQAVILPQESEETKYRLQSQLDTVQYEYEKEHQLSKLIMKNEKLILQKEMFDQHWEEVQQKSKRFNLTF